MKNILVLFLSLASLVSCQEDNSVEPEANAYPQTWQLVKLTGQIPNYIKTGADLPWQETYVFQGDSTFTKTRQQGDQLLQASGTFSLRNFSDGQYATLTYAAANSIIGSCTTSILKETLVIKANDTLVSTWLACDGPGLEYKRVK
ncbi:hypothetical protein [Hymenobacter volaticus]|uniref:Lipocalin-like domain-containing protein n=1 Tax=Hymenobacter volaticus TaxID=2932254 RepID=A0ABY4GBP6_9BACT|nr:hypothetical protein [Hymenobacter volaticus]UOQ68339.1 hypothetical protein MUN86_11080 [Hymenobacter volaticus]